MYWIYLIIFTVIVFVPSFIRSGYWGFHVVQSQEFVILILGSMAFLLYLIQDGRYKRRTRENVSMRKTVNRMSKDLTHSYSYIGEINRKLDILENVTAGFPETSELPTRRKIEIYDSIMAAVQMFVKSENFVLRFVNERNHEVLKEFRSRGYTIITYCQKDCPEAGYFFETDELIFARSSKSIDNIYACIIIKKKISTQAADDPNILKTLAMQALFLFMFIQEKRSRIRHVDKKD